MWQLLYLVAVIICIPLYPNKLADEQFILAQKELTKGSSDQAIASYQKALSFDPQHFDSHIALAKIYYESKQSDLAINHYKQAAQVIKNDARVYYNIGQAYAQKEAWSDALEYYQRASQINPNHIQAGVH